MNGKNFNNLVTILKAMKVDAIPLTREVVLISDDHVMMLQVKDSFGEPVLGVERVGRSLEIKHLPKLPDEEFETVIDEARVRYNLETETMWYGIPMTDEPVNIVKVPKLDTLHEVTVPAKTLKNALKQLGKVDFVTFTADGRKLTVGYEVNGVECSVILADCIHSFDVRFPRHHLKACELAQGDVTMELATDYPGRWSWTDGQYDYTVIIGPRIEVR